MGAARIVRRIGVQVGADWLWTFLKHLRRPQPDPGVSRAGSNHGDVSISDRNIDESALRSPVELASGRHSSARRGRAAHAQQSPDSGTGEAGRERLRRLMKIAGGGRNGHSCRPGLFPPCWAWMRGAELMANEATP